MPRTVAGRGSGGSFSVLGFFLTSESLGYTARAKSPFDEGGVATTSAAHRHGGSVSRLCDLSPQPPVPSMVSGTILRRVNR